MKTLYKLLALFIFLSVNSFAQSIAISNIDASNFPKVVSYISIMEYGGKSIQNIKLDSLKLYENGLDLSHTIELDCRDSILDPPLSITLIVDRSNSMEQTPDGQSEPLKEWLKIGANAFVDALNFSNGTKVELISFSTGMKLEVPFTSDKILLKNKIDSMKFAGGTNYNPPFLDDYVGAIKRMGENTPPDVRRVIVFLTDGDPDGANVTQVNNIVTSSLSNNIQIYCITLNRPMNTDLSLIASRTGGKAYPVYNKAQLTSVYQTIASEIKTKKICKITWISPFSCSNQLKKRDVTLIYQPIDKEVKTSYSLPNSAYFINKVKPSPLYFDNPPIGEYTEKVFEITPQNSDWRITGYQFQPSTYFTVVDWDDDVPGVQSYINMTIPKNKAQKIKVRFTPAESQLFRKASFDIYGDPCNSSIELIGGLSQVVLTSPDNGEVFSNCETVEISWTGSEPQDDVFLYYREEGNNYWNLLVSGITTNTYSWNPPTPNKSYNIKVQSYKTGIVEWVKSFGSIGNETISNMLVDYSGNNIYLIGTYDKPFVLQNNNMMYEGGKEGYIVNYDADGFVNWITTVNGSDDDLVNDICQDSVGNVYITGRLNSTSRIGNVFATGTSTKNYFAFIAKFSPYGDLIGQYLFDPTRDNPQFISNGRKIAYDNTNKTITIWGNYSGDYFGRLRNRTNGIFQLTIDDNLFSVSDLRESYTNFNNSTKFIAQDSLKNTYTAASYSDIITIGGKDYPSNGATDIYLSKKGFTKFTTDTLEQDFSVNTVQFDIQKADIDFGTSLAGISNVKRIDGFIYNKGIIPVNITNTKFVNNVHFGIKDNLIDYTIHPNDSLNVTFTFTPSQLGVLQDKFIIDYDCHTSDTINLTGYSICNYTSDSIFTFNKTILNHTSTQTISNVFTNNETIPIEIDPMIQGVDKAYFRLVSPSGKTLIPAKSSINFEIEFTPTQEREYFAYIEYNANSECNNDSTLINGLGINGEILLSDLDFGLKRVKTLNTIDINANEAIVIVTNPTEIPIVINQIKFEDITQAQNNGFEFVDNFNYPINISGNGTYDIKIRFTPKDEAKVTSNLIVNIAGKSNDYKAIINGEGFIPKFTYEWTCPPAVYPGSTSFGQFVIKIHNSKTDVFIKDIKFGKGINSNYEIQDNVKDLILSKQSSQEFTFNVKFSPTATGMITDDLIITSDAIEGPNPTPLVDSIYAVSCEANGNTFENKLQFDKKIICSNSTEQVTVRNTSSSTTLSVISYEILNDDDKVFNFTSVLPVSINPNAEQNFNIDFAPSGTKKYTATLKLLTDDGQPLLIDLEGEGGIYSLYTNIKSFEEEPNKILEIPLTANIVNFNENKLDSISFILQFNETILAPLSNNPVITSSYNNAIWEVTKISRGTYKYTGIGTFTLPITSEVATLSFRVYLGDTNFTNIVIHPLFNSCTSSDELLTKVNLKNVCLLDERRIEFFNSQTKIKNIYPNPIQKNLNLDYSLSIEAPVTIEIYSELGIKVREILNTTQKAGDYNINYNIKDLNSGVYYIKLKQSSITEIKKILIIQ